MLNKKKKNNSKKLIKNIEFHHFHLKAKYKYYY